MNAKTRKHKLTPREIEVLGLIAQGLTNKAIGQVLNITTGTVNSHVHHIIQKLEVANRAQATVWAIHNGLLSGESFGTGSKDNT